MEKKFLDQAIKLATIAHAGTFDRGGTPYILHPIAVMHMLNTDDEELQCIAVLHDIIEDTTVTSFMLQMSGFTQRIIDGVEVLTKTKGQSYEEYKKAVFSNRDAMKVKLCDIRHNSDLRRLKNKKITEKDVSRMNRYMDFYKELEERLKD